MWYPEEGNTYCPDCDIDIPVSHFWRGRGYSICGRGKQQRITVLYSQCPECAKRYTTGLEGRWWYVLLYGWLWRLRYPGRRAPAVPRSAVREIRRRAANE